MTTIEQNDTMPEEATETVAPLAEQAAPAGTHKLKHIEDMFIQLLETGELTFKEVLAWVASHV